DVGLAAGGGSLYPLFRRRRRLLRILPGPQGRPPRSDSSPALRVGARPWAARRSAVHAIPQRRHCAHPQRPPSRAATGAPRRAPTCRGRDHSGRDASGTRLTAHRRLATRGGAQRSGGEMRTIGALCGLLVVLGTGASLAADAPPPLRVGIAPNYPPLAFKENGELKGIEVDFAKRLGTALG